MTRLWPQQRFVWLVGRNAGLQFAERLDKTTIDRLAPKQAGPSAAMTRRSRSRSRRRPGRLLNARSPKNIRRGFTALLLGQRRGGNAELGTRVAARRPALASTANPLNESVRKSTPRKGLGVLLRINCPRAEERCILQLPHAGISPSIDLVPGPPPGLAGLFRCDWLLSRPERRGPPVTSRPSSTLHRVSPRRCNPANARWLP